MGGLVEEVSEGALQSLRTAVNDVASMAECGNSTDEYEALQYLVLKAEELLTEIGYG